MAEIIFFTQAYNSEKTLAGTIESVLRQTYGDFIYYIFDNDSTDKTGYIISEYARQDGRIVATRKDINNFHVYLDVVSDCCHRHPDGFWAMLDADDEYKPDFLEKMLAFMQANSLDIAACGSDVIDENTKQPLTRRKIEQDLLLSGTEFSGSFGNYHPFMRTIWGKVYSIPLLRKCSFDKVRSVRYGADTIFVMETFRRAARVGILKGTLHKYYTSTKSVSYRWDLTRVESIHLLDYMTRSYLRGKCGEITQLNDHILSLIHFDAITETLTVLLGAELAFTEKIQNIKDIVSHKKVQKLFLGNYIHGRDPDKKIRDSVLTWILSQMECRKADGAKAAAEILMAMYQDLSQFIKQDCLEHLLMKMPEIIESVVKKDYNRILERLQAWFETHGADDPYLTELEISSRGALNISDDEKLVSIHPLPSKKPETDNRNGCDTAFFGLMERLKTTGIDALLTEAVESVSEYRSTNFEYYELLLKWHKNWYGVGSFDIGDQGFVNYFGSMYRYLQQHIDDLAWLYKNLENYRSKYQLKTILQHWLTFKPDIREHGIEKTFAHYYDLDIIKCGANEVFVDCGAYDGDSIINFIEQYGGQYKSIYGYELTPSTFKKAVNNLKDYKRVFMRNAGVADKNGTMTFIDGIGDEGSGNRLMPNGNVVGRIVKLDDDIKEDVTFIKMDIEGAEIAALLGSQDHIRRSKPKLAVSLYHKLTDLIEIPKLIKQLAPEYRLYFQHCPGQFPFPTEYLILAIIDEENKESVSPDIL